MFISLGSERRNWISTGIFVFITHLSKAAHMYSYYFDVNYYEKFKTRFELLHICKRYTIWRGNLVVKVSKYNRHASEKITNWKPNGETLLSFRSCAYVWLAVCRASLVKSSNILIRKRLFRNESWFTWRKDNASFCNPKMIRPRVAFVEKLKQKNIDFHSTVY